MFSFLLFVLFQLVGAFIQKGWGPFANWYKSEYFNSKESAGFFARYGTEPSSCLTCSICISDFSMPHAIITPLRNAAICNWRDNNDFINKIITPGI